MKKLLIILLALMFPFTLPALSEAAADLIPGGTFDTLDPFWGLYTESGGSASIVAEDGILTVRIDAAGSVAHAVQVYCDGFSLCHGGRYRLSFDISSETERTLEWRIQLNGGDYHAYAGSTEVAVGPDAQTLSYEFTMEEPDDPSPRFCFNLGDAGKAQGLGAHALTIDNVSLIRLDCADTPLPHTEADRAAICIDQVGYLPDAQKLAVVRDVALGTTFEVIDRSTGNTALRGPVLAGARGGSSEDNVGWADFSRLSVPGTYTVRIGDAESSPFTISDGVYSRLLTASVRMLYLQRCGSDLPSGTDEGFAHPACHTDRAIIYGSGNTIDVSGGWHDAGDYGRYTVPGAKAAADLLLAYETAPTVFTDDTGIPESENGIPDILDEARYELEWLLKMQREDGAVYHKVTGLDFDAVVMPQDCTAVLFVSSVSATATGDFAAVMYMSARIYSDIDPDFSAACLAAADRALTYTQAHYTDAGFRNTSDCSTGEYPDDDATDEYLWALCEAYRTTGNTDLVELILATDVDMSSALCLGWSDMTGYARYAASCSGLTCFDNALHHYADILVKMISSESYHCSIAEDYPWGSNMTVACNGILLLEAESLTGNSAYRVAAEQQLHYLLGVNTNGFCFVSGFGTDSLQHPHHRPSQALGSAMPGMLSGGPNSNLEDPYAANVLAPRPKAARYADNDQTYSCNEVTVYWNSSLVRLLAGLIAD